MPANGVFMMKGRGEVYPVAARETDKGVCPGLREQMPAGGRISGRVVEVREES